MVDPPQNNTADSSILSGTSDAPVNNVTRRFRVLRIVNTGSLSQVDAGEGASAAAATHPAQGHSTASTPSFPQAARANQAPRAPSAAQPAQPSRSALQSSSSNSAAQPYVNPRARFQDPSTRNAFMSQGASGNPPGLTPNGARVNPTGSAPNNDGAVPSSKNPDTSLGFSGFPKEDLPREWLSAICKFCGPNGGAVKKVGKVRKVHVKSRHYGPVHSSMYRPRDKRQCITVCVKGVRGVECCHVFKDGTGTRSPYDQAE